MTPRETWNAALIRLRSEEHKESRSSNRLFPDSGLSTSFETRFSSSLSYSCTYPSLFSAWIHRMSCLWWHPSFLTQNQSSVQDTLQKLIKNWVFTQYFWLLSACWSFSLSFEFFEFLLNFFPIHLPNRKAVRATLILIPLLGLQYVLTPFRPAPGSPGENVYEVLAAVFTSFQVSHVPAVSSYRKCRQRLSPCSWQDDELQRQQLWHLSWEVLKCPYLSEQVF